MKSDLKKVIGTLIDILLSNRSVFLTPHISPSFIINNGNLAKYFIKGI